MKYEVIVDGKPHLLEVERGDGVWNCRLDGRDMLVDAVMTGPDMLSLLVEGRSYEVKREQSASDLHVSVGDSRFTVEVRDPRSLRSRRGSAGDHFGPLKLACPMPGKVVRILVAEKAEVEAGQGIVVVEAMKMQNEIKSPKKGVVQRIQVVAGASVNAGDVLAIVE